MLSVPAQSSPRNLSMLAVCRGRSSMLNVHRMRSQSNVTMRSRTSWQMRLAWGRKERARTSARPVDGGRAGARDHSRGTAGSRPSGWRGSSRGTPASGPSRPSGSLWDEGGGILCQRCTSGRCEVLPELTLLQVARDRRPVEPRDVDEARRRAEQALVGRRDVVVADDDLGPEPCDEEDVFEPVGRGRQQGPPPGRE